MDMAETEKVPGDETTQEPDKTDETPAGDGAEGDKTEGDEKPTE